MIPAPLIMEAAISRRVEGVLRRTVLVLGASGELSELSSGGASGPVYTVLPSHSQTIFKLDYFVLKKTFL